MHHILLFTVYSSMEDTPGLTSASQSSSQSPSPVSFSTLLDYIKSLPRTQRRLLASLEQCTTDVVVWRAMRSKRTLYLASDGGLQGHQGTFGWVISSKREILYKCSGPVDGPRDTANSTRSESAGFASGVLFLQSLAQLWGLRHRCKIRWLADSKAALARVRWLFRREYQPGRQPNDADLIAIIHSAIRDIRRPITPEWIKEHQDHSCPYSRLPFRAKLKIKFDLILGFSPCTGR
jgi:hypothetical protein